MEHEYNSLDKYAKQREQEISGMLTPFIRVTDSYGQLLVRICMIVGQHEPTSIQDAVLRDLMADVFDFLYESRVFILRGQTLVAYPLARRAYESLTLMHWCSFDEKAAEKWHKGKQIGNSEIRNALGAHPMGEDEQQLRELYNFYCGLTHPNRKMVAHRGLGEGNSFVFGSIGSPNLVELAQYCLKHLDLWFWFCPIAVWSFKDLVLREDNAFHSDHNDVREEAQQVRKWLIEQYNAVLTEWKDSKNIVQPKYS